MTDLELTANEESIREADREDAIFSRQCLSTNSAGEQCALTLHLTGLHTWETK